MAAADTFELPRHDLTWEELAAVAGSDQLTREDRSLVELARLIQRQDDVASVAEQIQIVDDLAKIASDFPALMQRYDSQGLLPLHVAVKNELSLEHIKILVEAYPKSVTAIFFDEDGWPKSAIRAARTVETQEFLVDQAIRNLHSSLLEHGLDGIHYFFKLHYTVEYVVQRLVEEFPDFLSKAWLYSPQRTTLPLHYTIEQHAPVEVLETLISAYPKALVTRDTRGETPLHVAIQEGHLAPDEMQLLITSKSVRVCNKDGELPLHSYLRRHDALDLEVIKSMVELFPKSIRTTTKSGDTPLHIVCRHTRADENHNVSVIRFLMDKYPCALTMTDKTGSTPLCCICEGAGEGQVILPALHMLAEACPESVRQLDHSGNTVLHRYLLFIFPGRLPDLSVVECLVKAYPGSLKIRDKVKKRTPLHIACERHYEGVVRFLVTECPEVLESADGMETPLHGVCSNVDMALPPSLLMDDAIRAFNAKYNTRTSNIIRTLAISEKAVMAKDSLGQTPLHLLSEVGACQQFLRVIIEKCPAAAGETDSKGRIPLHSAIEGCPNAPSTEEAHAFEDVVRYLLDVHPLGVHCMDDDGMTPLMLACEWDVSLSIIYQLVKVDPFSNQRRREWSQVPWFSSMKHSPSLWIRLLSAFVFAALAAALMAVSPKEVVSYVWRSPCSGQCEGRPN